MNESDNQYKITKNIVIGTLVKRINTPHGDMLIGDESVVIDIVMDKYCLEKDFEMGFMHDINNIERVSDNDYNIGDTVRRINIPHGGMKVGDESIVVEIICNKLALEIDYQFNFTHDTKNIERVIEKD